MINEPIMSASLPYMMDVVGDAMCQQAIHLMKTAVKTASQHKQKIIIRVNMSGVTLVDSVTNVSVKVL